MGANRRCGSDRRSGTDRREVIDPNYFLRGGIDTRDLRERRSRFERRAGWIRMSDLWCSSPAREFRI